MRILIDARLYGLENSGIGRYLINLIDNLKEIDLKNNYVVLLKKEYFDQLNFPNNWKKVLANFRHYTIKEQIQLPKLINNERPNLVHFPHINIPILYNGRFLVTIHDMTMHFQKMDATTLPVYKYLFKRVPYKLAFRKAVTKSKMILTPSKSVKDEIVDYFGVDPSKIKVTYEGINFSFENKRKNKSEQEILSRYGLKVGKYFFYVGNAYPHKNLGLVIKAIKSLNKGKESKITFAAAGSKNIFVERLRDLVNKEKAQEFVKILGYVPDYDLQILYRGSIALIYPSLSEGFGLQGLEAMASGSLVLASDIPVFKEIYKSYASYFDPRNADSLVKTMKTVMKMSNQGRQNIIKKSKEFIQRYSWKKMAEETLEAYKDALEL